MKRILIENAKPGQILAEKLQRHDGVLLAGQGAEITEGLLRMLSRMNVDSIVIEEEIRQTPEELEAAFAQYKSALEARFVRVRNQPVLMALKAAMLSRAKREKDESLAMLAALDAPSAPKEGDAK